VVPSGSIQLKPGQNHDWFQEVKDPLSRPTRRSIRIELQKGDAKNVRVEIEAPRDSKNLVKEGAAFDVPSNGMWVRIRLLARNGAEPTCFEDIFFRVYGESGNEIGEGVRLAQNVCVEESFKVTTTQEFKEANQRLETGVFIKNTAGVGQMFSLKLENCSFTKGEEEMLVEGQRVALDATLTVKAGNPISITVYSYLRGGTPRPPVFSCNPKIERRLGE
jgi:hypothetical protein